MQSIGVLTTINPNHGSSIFNYSLNAILKSNFPYHQTRFIRYRPWDRMWYEPLRALKPNIKIPFYNLLRYHRLMKFDYDHLDVDPIAIGSHPKSLKTLIGKNYDALVVGKDIWDVSASWHLPGFPNLFWLSAKIPAAKFAYAVTAHRLDLNLLKQFKKDIKPILDSYSIIGVRDDFTLNMLDTIGIDPHVTVLKVPDPAFMFNGHRTDTDQILTKYGISTDRPLLGLLLYGKPEFSRAIYQHYRSIGYQIINFNMFNPYVDFNLGHKVNTFEWAELFQHLNFCITDRFHCSVFCIKSGVPFVSIEPYPPRTLSQSKIFDLLKNFDLTDCYQNTYQYNFDMKHFLGLCDEIESDWQKTFLNQVNQKYDETKAKHDAFIELIQNFL